MAVSKVFLSFLLATSFYVDSAHGIFWWYWPFTTTTTTTTTASSASSSASGSNYVVNVGNRENTNTSLTDYGTQISNLQINLARFNGTAFLMSATGDDSISTLIASVSEEYQERLEALVSQKNEWFSQRLAEAQEFAASLQQFSTQILLKSFDADIRGNVASLNESLRSCVNRRLDVPSLIKSVVDLADNGCLDSRIESLLYWLGNAHQNLGQLVAVPDDLEEQLVQCNNPDLNFADDLEELYTAACVSSVLFKARSNTFRLELTIDKATEAADAEFGQARAQLLSCVADLESHAFNATLGLHNSINSCENHL